MTEQLAVLPDVQERLSALVSKAARHESLDESKREESNLVAGCVSRVFLHKSFEETKCRFQYHADSPLVAGLVGLLCELCDGAEAGEIVTFQPTILEDLGIWKNLSGTRQQGLLAVLRTMQHFAASCP